MTHFNKLFEEALINGESQIHYEEEVTVGDLTWTTEDTLQVIRESDREDDEQIFIVTWTNRTDQDITVSIVGRFQYHPEQGTVEVIGKSWLEHLKHFYGKIPEEITESSPSL